MFFSISLESESKFPNHLKVNDFCVSYDNGWYQQETKNNILLYKGYLDDHNIDDIVSDVVLSTKPTYLGNFCVINFDKNLKSIRIHSDLYRSFPIYFQKGKISNLEKLESTAWADSLIEINKDFNVIKTKFDLIGIVDISLMPEDEVVDKIDQILQTKTKNFLSNNQLPIKAFLSGGIDTMLVYSYLQKFTEKFEIVRCNHIDYDYFWMQNSGSLRDLWGYNQIHHWNTPCVLTSGTPGDEFTLRNPQQVDVFLKYHRLALTDMLKDNRYQNCLHYSYFSRPKNLESYQNLIVDQTESRQQFFWNLCNRVVNDWQHWHLGNTLTWTPLRDLDIFKLILQLPLESAVNQAMNSDISKKLISKNHKDLIKYLSTQKNTDNQLSNLCDFFKVN